MPATKLNILVVGGGIGGLVAGISCREKGLDVRVLEFQEVFTHVGAGLMISPNATRILCDMGLREPLNEVATLLRRTLFMKWDDESLLEEKTFFDTEALLGGPLWQIHRGDLHAALLKHAVAIGVDITMGARVKRYNPDDPSVMLEDDSVLEADVILAADGYRSCARSQLLDTPSEPRPSGYSVFRALIPRSSFADDPDLARILDSDDQTTLTWVGGGKHVLVYPVRQGQYLNIGLNQPAVHVRGSAYVLPAHPTEIAEVYQGWNDRLLQIIRRLPTEPDKVLEWKLCDLEPLDSWIFPGGKIALLGDACHPMLPSAAQGAGMSIEDGSCIAELLARVTDCAQIPEVLEAYQRLRLPRCTMAVDSGRQNSKKWHKSDAKGGTVADEIWDYDVKSEARKISIRGI